MKKMILIAAVALTVATPALAEMSPYETCVTSEAMRLGKGNSVDAETIIRAAHGKCDILDNTKAIWGISGATANMMTNVMNQPTTQQELFDRMLKGEDDRALLALLEARSGK